MSSGSRGPQTNCHTGHSLQRQRRSIIRVEVQLTLAQSILTWFAECLMNRLWLALGNMCTFEVQDINTEVPDNVMTPRPTLTNLRECSH